MQESTSVNRSSSTPTWDTLDDWLRESVQRLIQLALEEEVTQLLGRTRYERREAVDGQPGSRNGHGKPRSSRTIPTMPEDPVASCLALDKAIEGSM